jgi:hypothetical protein
MKPHKILTRSATVVSLIIAFACGGGQTPSPTSPTAPSGAAPPSSGSASGSAVITGTLAGFQTASSSSHGESTGLTVTVTGTGISATVVPGGQFVLNGVPAGNVDLHFTGVGVDAHVSIANVVDSETIRIVVNVSGTRANVTITDRQAPKPGAELEGLITSINSTARTLVVNGQTVSVPTTARIRHGDVTLMLADLRIGQRVHVKGTLSGSTVVASEVILQDEQTAEAEVEGTVSGLSGACPALTFTVKATKVTTTATTQFSDTTCSKVTNGVGVEVTGTRQTDGSIVARRVSINKGDK